MGIICNLLQIATSTVYRLLYAVFFRMKHSIKFFFLVFSNSISIQFRYIRCFVKVSLYVAINLINRVFIVQYRVEIYIGEKKVFPSKEEPTLFAKMIFNAIGMGVLSLTEAAHLLDISIDEFRNQIDSVA